MYTDFHDQNGNPVSASIVMEAIKDPIIRHDSFFNLFNANSQSPFTGLDEDDYIRESLIITNSCGSDGIKLGSVNIGMLKITVKNNKVASLQSPADLIDCRIIPRFEIRIDDNTIAGVTYKEYWVKEVEQLAEGVKLTCYDGMCKLDTPFSGALSGTPYQILTAAATACGVRVQSTQAEIEALPNGTKTFTLHEDNDCRTWRDVLSYLSALMGCFVTFGRRVYRSYDLAGIEVRPFGGGASSFCDTITDSQRYTGAKFSLWNTAYAEFTLKAYALEDPNDPDSAKKQDFTYTDTTISTEGQTYDLGYNPFLQATTPETGLTQDQIAILHDLLEKVATYQYTPLQITLPVGFIYDLGDVIKCTGRLANTGFAGGSVDDAYGVILNETYTYGRDYRIKSLDSHAGKGRTVIAPPPPPSQKYECSTANELLIEYSFISYYKSTDDLAYVAWLRTSSLRTGPILVSRTENGVKLTDGRREWTSKGTVTFGGETWYYNYEIESVPGSYQKQDGMAAYIGQFNQSEMESAVTFLLKLANGSTTLATKYECSTVNALLATLTGREYYKVSGDLAYVAYMNIDSYYGPLLVSKIENGVTYRTEGRTFSAQGTITFGGETWYYCPSEYWMNYTQNTNGIAEYIGGFSDTEAAAIQLLTWIFE